MAVPVMINVEKAEIRSEEEKISSYPAERNLILMHSA